MPLKIVKSQVSGKEIVYNMDHGDSVWITNNKIKHEEPLELFLISPTTDEELNVVGFDKHSNFNDEHLEVS